MTLILRRKMGDGKPVPRPPQPVPPDPVWNPRRSGRTTRMLAAAMVAAREGLHVYLLFATPAQAQPFAQAIREAVPGARVEVLSQHDRRIEWAIRPYFRDLEGGSEVFIDHHLLEVVYAHVLQRFHRYDRSPP